MKNNPFLTDTFSSVWSKHFDGNKTPVKFKCFKNAKFVKSRLPRLFYNVGKNITNGMSYELAVLENDHKGRVFLFHDVPSYFDLSSMDESSLIRIKVPQYKGFLSDLRSYGSYDDFLKSQFKSNSRYKFRRNQERLETCFNIDYSIYHGEIEGAQYDQIMAGFKNLLSKRFNALGKENDILIKWDYYYDLIFKMLKDKHALLIVISNNDIPIGVSLSFLSDSTMFYAITSFDTDYYRFNLGHTTIIKLLNWCYSNGYDIYDFSKGEYEYKNRWTNTEYTYENHILYDPKSTIARLVAGFVSNKYRLKQYLRDKDINEKYVRLKFLIRGKRDDSKMRYSVEPCNAPSSTGHLHQIDIESDDYAFLRPVVFDRLYKNPIPIRELNVYKDYDGGSKTFIVVGPGNTYRIILN